MTTLAEQLPTFGQYLLNRYGERVHKIALDTAFTCPNRDGTKGLGGCTFCNNVSFSPNGRRPKPINEQLQAGREVIRKRTGAKKYLAYFQAYTNTYDSLERLTERYDEALAEQDVIGLSIGTRPDCVPDGVLELLSGYQAQGYEIWLELGLQSAFDETLEQVNRGHGFAEYQDAVLRARSRGIKVCTHLIAGLPGETAQHNRESLRRVTTLGTDGLKLHPLHVVKGTQLANSWRNGEYTPLTMNEYIQIAADLVEQAPDNIVWHRLTGTASEIILLTPAWCTLKWRVLNGITRELQRRRQSCRNVA
ncbi:MAG: TIGR01212 family radical SAM protein [Candidatus Thiodiazotropha lotti]|nr:TIGR01212 family radical SAM protein [Candidatus Thiodiazotropha lotti]MCG8003463.1 TIGR01212 family radical SAM protein [Candidatus Thiodiazotropha lotti]MCG8009402.1 TIGR01212 family radical SAM protein [Candidatus Thiodiazotropha lotti]MCW4187084.1 TIGR01212 family radical SAM protein [Candidatus Thiodiazotropha lotti]MCW4196994.1 TIGR01212 family radical SAM protein [Candidatus Thiodiazotropha lotti]